MKKAYEVTFKDGNEFKTVTVKGYTLIGAHCTIAEFVYNMNKLVIYNEYRMTKY